MENCCYPRCFLPMRWPAEKVSLSQKWPSIENDKNLKCSNQWNCNDSLYFIDIIIVCSGPKLKTVSNDFSDHSYKETPHRIVSYWWIFTSFGRLESTWHQYPWVNHNDWTLRTFNLHIKSSRPSVPLTHWHQWPLLLTWFNFNPSMDK